MRRDGPPNSWIAAYFTSPFDAMLTAIFPAASSMLATIERASAPERTLSTVPASFA
jgi:hypothetical protein